jgi:hypothetical protein
LCREISSMPIWVMPLRSLQARPKTSTEATAAATVPHENWNCRATWSQGSDLAQVATAMASAQANCFFPTAHGRLSTWTDLQCGQVMRHGA